jgi:hypothetical protein
MVDEDADVEVPVARLRARLKQEGFHLPIGPEANQQTLCEVVVSLLSEQLSAQFRDLQTMNDTRERWLGRGWAWEESHSEEAWWPPASALEPARAVQDSALESCLELLRVVDWARGAFGRAAQQAESLGGTRAAVRPLELDVLTDTVIRLIEEYRRSARHFAVLRTTNPLYELWRVRTSDDPAVFEEALDSLVGGEYRTPIYYGRWKALSRQLQEGIAAMGKALKIPSGNVVPTLVRILLEREIPKSLASSPAELIQDLKRRLNRLVTDALVPREHLDRPPWQEVSIETYRATLAGRSLCWDAREFDPTTAAQRLAVARELARDEVRTRALVLAKLTHGGFEALAREEGIPGGTVRKRFFAMKKRMKSPTAGDSRRGTIPTRSLATAPWVSGFVNYPGHGPLDRRNDVLMPSGLPGQPHSRSGVTGVEAVLRYVDLDVLTVYRAEVAGPTSTPQAPAAVAFCPSCGGTLGARAGVRRCVATTKRGVRQCAGCGRPVCSHAPWCRADQHQHHFKPQDDSGTLACVECGVTLSAAEVR